jgi:hypothetical protein
MREKERGKEREEAREKARDEGEREGGKERKEEQTYLSRRAIPASLELPAKVDHVLPSPALFISNENLEERDTRTNRSMKSVLVDPAAIFLHLVSGFEPEN